MMPDTLTHVVPQSQPSTIYYYTLMVGNQKRQGEVEAPSAADALRQIGQKVTEKDMRTGRIDVSMFRLH